MNQFVEWSGYIFYKKATLKGYHLYWGMLMRESASGLKRINLYENQAQSLTNLSVELADALSVKAMKGKGRSSSHRYEFQIMTTSGKHQFATKTEEECRKWMEKINRMLALYGSPEPGVLYEFQLQVMPTSHSDKLALVGYYVMRVTDNTVMLYSSSGTFSTVFHCELAHITKVQCTYVTGHSFPLLTLQTSSHAKIGKGGFAFFARSAADIAAVIEHRRRLQPAAATKPRKAPKPLVTDSEIRTRPHQRPLPPRQNRTGQKQKVSDSEVQTRPHQRPLPSQQTRPHQRPLPSQQNRTSQELREEQAPKPLAPKPLVTDSEVPTRRNQHPLPPGQNRISQEVQELKEEHSKNFAPSLALLHTLQLPNQAKPNDQTKSRQNPKPQTAKPPVSQPRCATLVAPPTQNSPPSVKSESPPLVPSSDSSPTSVKPLTSHKPPVMPKPPVKPPVTSKPPTTSQQLRSTSPLPPSTSPRPNFSSLQARKSEQSLSSGDENSNSAPGSNLLPNVLPRPLKDSKSQPNFSSKPNETDKRNSWASVAQYSENPESWIVKKPPNLKSRPERSSLAFMSKPPSQNFTTHWQDVERGQDCSSLTKMGMSSRWMKSTTKPHPISKEASYICILPHTADSKDTTVSPKVVRELPEGSVMQRQSTIRRAKSEESLHKGADIPQGDQKRDFHMDSFELQVNPAYDVTELDLTSSLTISPYAILREDTNDCSPYSIMYSNDGDILYADDDSIDSRPPAFIPVVGEIEDDELYVDCYPQSEDVSYDYIHRGAFYKGRRERKVATYIDIQRSGWTPSIPLVTVEEDASASQTEKGKHPSLERRPRRSPPPPPHPYGQTIINQNY